MRLPGLDRRYIAAEKIVAYLLNVDHPKGGAKARFFMRFGFSSAAPETLHTALLEHPVRFEVSDVGSATAGTMYVVDGPLSSPDGRDPWVRTVWRLQADGVPALVTAYPAREGG